ncbi:hypothetical protein GJ744_001713 [Endocarpon pusillum]|uniref:Uncharacterized protein n=1 Tax=Endocarpon pusillum TaxID=364733 RepID=A0A8H7A8W9_9EURO|nr:hypothetical protein GJ744_001713 [Endocarpon pusillum]
MFRILSLLVNYFAPLFLVLSPITSYADQIISIHQSKTSDGFSLDIPLIMLVASILKILYWFGEYYSLSLLTQAILMLFVQSILLKVALDNRPPIGMRGFVRKKTLPVLAMADIKTILPVPSLPHPRPLRPPHLHTSLSDLRITSVHCLPRLCRSHR